MGTFIAKSSGSWTLDKNGSGSLTLSGNNTNMTCVSATTVAINGGRVIGTIPEPGTFVLAGLGLTVLLGRRLKCRVG